MSLREFRKKNDRRAHEITVLENRTTLLEVSIERITKVALPRKARASTPARPAA